MEILRKLVRASLLESSLYEEVQKDKEVMWQAYVVVLVCSLCNGIGNVGLVGVQGIIPGFLFGLVGWFFWSGVIYLIGVKLFEYKSDMGGLLRCTAFAYAPAVISIFGVIPSGVDPTVGIVFRTISSLWLILTFIKAVKQALGTSLGMSVFIVVQGFVVYLIVLILVGLYHIFV